MTVPDVIETGFGPVTVRHRLALGVEPLDALIEAPCSARLRVARELPPRRPGSPLRLYDLEARGTARFKLRHVLGVGSEVTVRIGDTDRRLVPRRFLVQLWTLAEVAVAEAGGPAVRVRSRVLRPWLLPGSAAAVPPGTTAIRGRVAGDGDAVRWPRLTALGRGDVPVGWAHGDERGEFLLIIIDTGTLPPPPPDTLNVRLLVRANPAAPAPDPADPWADLPVEEVRRSRNPPTPGDLDNARLRGRAAPPGYRPSNRPPPTLRVTVGEVLGAGDVPFVP